MRVALFGGSFNPPHAAHVLAVDHLLESGDFDRVLVVPVFEHPFDKSLAPYADRVTMCELAFPHEDVVVSRVEEQLERPSLTLHTIERLLGDHPDWKLRLVVGSDVLGDADKWHRFDEVTRLAPIYALGRVGYERSDVEPARLPDVSSTRVRRLIAKGTPQSLAEAATLVPAAVFGYIRERGLYR
jgi:nicotinate-nucleotide adenylyltransferase